MRKKKFLFLSVFLFAPSIFASWLIKPGNAHAAIYLSKTNGEYLLNIQKNNVWQKTGSPEGLALEKLSPKDFDLIDAFEKTIELSFPAIQNKTLTLMARVEDKKVPPSIGTTYPNDKDMNRIDDALFKKIKRALMLERSAVSQEEKTRARSRLARMVDVELIFTEQVTQQQIDAFLALGGKITYRYKSVSYGWNGRIPLGKIEAIPSIMGEPLVLVDEPKTATLH